MNQNKTLVSVETVPTDPPDDEEVWIWVTAVSAMQQYSIWKAQHKEKKTRPRINKNK